MPRRKYKEIGIDDSVFQERVVKLARKFKVDEKQFIKDQSRLLARDAARFTPPFAQFPDWHKGTHIGTKADLVEGEWAVYKDLRRIFEVLPDSVIWKEHKYSKGGPIYRHNAIRSPGVITDGFKMHQWHRDNKRPNGRTKKLKKPGIPWVGESLFYEYLKSQQASVGMAKASFLKASMAFGGKSSATPKIKRHLARTSGSGNLVKTGKGYDGHIRAKAEGLYHLIRLLPHLRRNRTKKAEKRLEILAKKAVKSSGFKTR
jgi:hypothetical protein